METVNFTYSVKAMRDSGLEARWGKTSRGAPIMLVRNPKSELKHQRECWWYLDNGMRKAMAEDGILEGFDRLTLVGDLFYVTD